MSTLSYKWCEQTLYFTTMGVGVTGVVGMVGVAVVGRGIKHQVVLRTILTPARFLKCPFLTVWNIVQYEIQYEILWSTVWNIMRIHYSNVIFRKLKPKAAIPWPSCQAWGNKREGLLMADTHWLPICGNIRQNVISQDVFIFIVQLS